MAKSTDELLWRETYFILFPQDRRPKLDKVTAAISSASPSFKIENPASNQGGMFESLLVESPQDHAAVEISYEVGDVVVEQTLEWAKELQKDLPADQLQEMIKADARLDVAHFERKAALQAEAPIEPSPYLSDDMDDEEGFEMLDPTCLLTVVDALAQLTNGLTFDPAAGEILS